MSKILIIDEEYWSIEPAIDRIKSVYGDDCCTYCADGSEGVESLRNGQFSCIILDIMFPLGSGWESTTGGNESINGGLIVLQYLRKTLKIKIPIICFTIRDDAAVKAEISRYTETFHVSKVDGRALELLMQQLKKYIK